MDFSLSTEQELMRREIVAFARATFNSGMVERDRHQVFPRDLWQACAGVGLPGLPVPRDYGGTGACAIALEAFGWIFRSMGGQHSGAWEASIPGHVRPRFRSM